MDNFRLVTYRGNDVSFIGDTAKIASGGRFWSYTPLMNQGHFELDKSKQYFMGW